MQEVKIKWKDLSLGDKFPDGSIVKGIEEPTMKPCIEIKVFGNEPIVVSEDHLLKFFVSEGGSIKNGEFAHTRKICAIVGADPSVWITAKDLLDSSDKGLSINTYDGVMLEYAELFDNGEPKECFCITTDTGHYYINGMYHHNTARILFYGMSDTEVIEDCGNSDSDGVMHCHAPGICRKCAKKSGWDIEKGQMVGSIISTNLTEGLTQASLSAIHISGKNESKADWEVIKDTLSGFSSSPVIVEAKKAKTTEEARQAIFKGLKKHYESAGIGVDDYNLQMVAKKLTSYKNDNGTLRFVKEGELCDLPSMQTIGGHNNIFLQAELRYSYDKLTTPGVYDNSNRNSVTEMI